MTKIDLPRSRQVGHLTLLREQRSISLKDFNKLAPDEQISVLQSSSGKKKYQLLVEAAGNPAGEFPPDDIKLLQDKLGRHEQMVVNFEYLRRKAKRGRK